MAGLLNIGEMGALGLHVLVELAMLRESDESARRTVQDLADQYHASVHTLQKVARRLIMLGMVDGTRGANGGLKLAVDANRITMLRVLEGVEGKIGDNNCLFAKRVCPAKSGCRFHGVTGGLEQTVRDYVSKTTIADLAATAATTV